MDIQVEKDRMGRIIKTSLPGQRAGMIAISGEDGTSAVAGDCTIPD